MLHKNERFIFFYDFGMELRPGKAAEICRPLEFEEILPGLKERFEAEKCVKLINKDNAVVRMLDLREDADAVSFLIVYADKNSANPAFMNFMTGKAKVLAKEKDEGGAVSAHCVILKRPSSKKPLVYSAAIERVPGVTRSIIGSFLNAQMREASNFAIRRKDQSPLCCWPGFNIVGQASSQLREALRTGQLKEIELVGYAYDDRGLDQMGRATERIHTLKIKPTETHTADENIHWINKVSGWGRRKGFHDLKIRYKASTGRTDTVGLSTMKDDVGDFLFTRHAVVQLDTQLSQCEEKISEELVSKMKALF